ncbi:MAG: four helix bundle protein [Bacteroidales bacterium]|nr:four helix bundle protein [Bacteroidales bacterium]
MSNFRFEDLQIWKEGIDVSQSLFSIADSADARKYFRFGEQLRAAAMSITNNIAEGSGSLSDKDFAQFLNISRRSVYECANILYLYERTKIIDEETRDKLLGKLVILSKMLVSLRKILYNK